MSLHGVEAIIAPLDWTADLSDRVVVVIYGYFDDSGTDAASPVTIMAGYVAHMDGWRAFEAGTKELYARESIPFFRAKLFDHGQRQFKGWSEPRRLRFATEWYGLARRHLIRGISCGVTRPDFATAKQAEDKRVPKLAPLTYAMQMAISHLCRNDEVWKQIETHGMSIIIESSLTADAGLQEDFHRIVDINGIGDHLRSIAFARKEDARALHLADYLAYYSHRFALTAMHHETAGHTPMLAIAQDNVPTLMKLGERHEPNPDYLDLFLRWRASRKRKPA